MNIASCLIWSCFCIASGKENRVKRFPHFYLNAHALAVTTGVPFKASQTLSRTCPFRTTKPKDLKSAYLMRLSSFSVSMFKWLAQLCMQCSKLPCFDLLQLRVDRRWEVTFVNIFLQTEINRSVLLLSSSVFLS